MAKKLRVDGFKTLGKYIDQFTDKESALIKVLYEAQHIFGYLSKEVMLFVADKMDVPAAKIFGVVTFYSYFTTVPKGRCQLKVCMGTACFVRGSETIMRRFEQELGVKRGETTDDRRFSLDSLRCVGACGLAPVVLANEKVFGKIDKDDVSKIIQDSTAQGAGS
ncbi:NAD(P)H-dependent oxidoreductase subunit E [Desulfovibrio sp. OttesenSCG-928-F20]|nr:NAD(P)H-dependent oxidoreductase subunit E [Desulfovibrio sp. OttesenSCG-928-M16]MDL2291392.1 NAD(P)H-dependent oxidoreductase subunit E [Desulfovibrio sp. OttesenSCG-928-F20]